MSIIVGDQTPDGEKLETLLFVIRHRIEAGQSPVLRPSEAAQLLEWALDSSGAATQGELLRLFKNLGGARMVREALSDFD